MPVPIHQQGTYLIATMQDALTDADVLRMHDELTAQVGRKRSRGIIDDVAAWT